MANSCKSAALLAHTHPTLVHLSYTYGKHIGLAFQLVDDLLDFSGTLNTLGKPSLSDLNAGIATAPVLFASQSHPELLPLIQRKFKRDNDVQRALDYIYDSDGIQCTRDLACVHAELAVDAVLNLEPSVYRDALVNLAFKVVDRSH